MNIYILYIRQSYGEDMSKRRVELESLRKYFEGLRALRFEEKKRKCRSVRELAHYLCIMKVKEVLNEDGVFGCELVNYTSFARKILGEVFNHGAEFLDDLLDCYEKIWIKRFGAKPELLGKVELVILATLENMDKIELEYLRMHNPEEYEKRLEQLEEKEREEIESSEAKTLEEKLRRIRQKYKIT